MRYPCFYPRCKREFFFQDGRDAHWKEHKWYERLWYYIGPMKTKLAITLLALTSMCHAAEPLPDAPSASRKPANVWLSPFRDPSFYAGTAIHITGVAVDVRFVQHCEQIHTCIEGNPGADQWKNRIPEIALGTLARYGCSLMLHDHKYWRMMCLAPSVAIAAYDIIDGRKIHYGR